MSSPVFWMLEFIRLTRHSHTHAAQAQQPTLCKPHAEVTQTLLDRYQEVVIAMGLAGTALFELYASKSGTWTVVLTRPSMNNLACIQGTGTDLQLTGNKYPPPKADPA